MQKMTIAFMLVVVTAGLTFAADNPEQVAVMKTVNQFADGFNKDDSKVMLAACAHQTSIIDDFAPHTWQSCSAWLEAFHAFAKKEKVTEGMVTLGDPKHVDVTGDRAYVVVPTTFTYKHDGEPTKEAGSTLTVVLQKGAAGWRIISWTWTMG